jgi:hypothetical protein
MSLTLILKFSWQNISRRKHATFVEKRKGFRIVLAVKRQPLDDTTAVTELKSSG